MNFVSRKSIVQRLLRSKESRNAFVFENIKRMIPFQVRTMRDEREWSQAAAGQALGKPQSVISRLESPAYGKLTLQTLLEIARGFDVGLLIKFVPFSRLVKEYDDVSDTALSAPSVSEKAEALALEQWANEEPAPARIFVDTSVLLGNSLPTILRGTTFELITGAGTRADVSTQRRLYPAPVPTPPSRLEPVASRTAASFLQGHSTNENVDYRSVANVR